jgi:hypothetical protein
MRFFSVSQDLVDLALLLFDEPREVGEHLIDLHQPLVDLTSRGKAD